MTLELTVGVTAKVVQTFLISATLLIPALPTPPIATS